MKKLITQFAILIVVTLFYSCSPAYIPTSIEVPTFKEKGEVNLSIQTGTCGFDPHVSFAITDNMAIMFNGSYADNHNDSNDTYHRHLTGEFGVGFYDNFAEIGFVQVFGGYGISNVKSNYDWNLDNFADNATSAFMQKFFIQPAAGIDIKYFEFAFSPRLTFLNITVDNYSTSDFFVEPVLLMKVGSPIIKVTGQLGLSFPTEEINYDYRPLIFNVGINVMLGRKQD